MTAEGSDFDPGRLLHLPTYEETQAFRDAVDTRLRQPDVLHTIMHSLSIPFANLEVETRVSRSLCEIPSSDENRVAVTLKRSAEGERGPSALYVQPSTPGNAKQPWRVRLNDRNLIEEDPAQDSPRAKTVGLVALQFALALAKFNQPGQVQDPGFVAALVHVSEDINQIMNSEPGTLGILPAFPKSILDRFRGASAMAEVFREHITLAQLPHDIRHDRHTPRGIQDKSGTEISVAAYTQTEVSGSGERETIHLYEIALIREEELTPPSSKYTQTEIQTIAATPTAQPVFSLTRIVVPRVDTPEGIEQLLASEPGDEELLEGGLVPVQRPALHSELMKFLDKLRHS